MMQQPRGIRESVPRVRRPRGWRKLLYGACALAVAATGLVVWGRRDGREAAHSLPPLSAEPSDGLRETLLADVIPFEQAVTDEIRQRCRVTVTVHVALADERSLEVPSKFGNGDDPTTNLFWGALYGVETHLANAAGWRRAHTDAGRGPVIRRVVFHRRAEPTAAWRARGVTQAFDVYVLANAWPSSQVPGAVERPLRDALSDEPVALTVEGLRLEFGAGSVMTGYVGPNPMLDQVWDPFAGMAVRSFRRQMGVFYVCSMSAVYLHQPVVERGLYSILFTRRPIVPEAYILEGVLGALLAGELADGFVERAAEQYAGYQKNVSPEQATFLFYR